MPPAAKPGKPKGKPAQKPGNKPRPYGKVKNKGRPVGGK